LKFFEFFVFFSLFCHFSLRNAFSSVFHYFLFFSIWRLFSVALFTDNTNTKKKKKKKKLSWNNTNNTNSQPHHVLQTGQTIAQTREGRKRHVLVIIIGTKQNSQA